MQDFRPFDGRVFGRGGWPAAQPAKCPRCESTNTKFCYYNNYNLAQPRHFCKACRRYWTKGGVLRNVPVGGGCRKSKRPSSSSSKTTSQPSANADAPSDSPQHRLPRLLSFSSDSLSDISTAVATPSSVPVLDPTPPDPPLESLVPPFCPAPEIFPDPPAMGLGFSDPPRAKAKAAPSLDQAVPADPTPRGGSTVAWAGGSLDPQLFELASSVDPSVYWNQSHWMDADPTLYLPYRAIRPSNASSSTHSCRHGRSSCEGRNAAIFHGQRQNDDRIDAIDSLAARGFSIVSNLKSRKTC